MICGEISGPRTHRKHEAHSTRGAGPGCAHHTDPTRRRCGASGIRGDPGEPIRQLRISGELLDETGNIVDALVAMDVEPLELADKVGGSERPIAGHSNPTD